MAKSSPLEQARQWWKERTDAERYVVAPSEAPSAAVTRVLREQGLVLDVANKRAWILTPGTPADGRAIFLANYWPVVALVLERYAPAAIAGISAVRMHLEDFSPPEELPVYQGANQSEYRLILHSGFRLRIRPRPLTTGQITRLLAPGKTSLPTQSPVDILSTLDEADVASGIEPLSAWLRHLIVRTPELEEAVTANPRPVILRRLAALAGELRNESLHRQLDQLIRQISHRKTSPSRTGVGTRIEVPDGVRNAPRGTGSPWLDEQAMRLKRQEAEARAIIGSEADSIPVYPWDALSANAEQNKAYDAYHSTTMEGYRITREVSDAIVRGEPLPEGPQDQKTLEAAMAVKGYTVAYEGVLARARRKAPIDTDLILDLYEALYRPSVDVGITDTAALRGWRTGPVQLHGWRYVPPNPKKIPDLIGGLERFAARKDLDPVTRAMLVQLEFVTIHPFMDGNGRLGRLLMNEALLSAGLPWVTIRSDERLPFFRSIERAQVAADTKPFLEFVWHAIKLSIKDLPARARRAGAHPARARPPRGVAHRPKGKRHA